MQFTGMPGQPLPRAVGVRDLGVDGRAAPRMPGRVLVGADVEPHPADPADRAGRLDRVRPGRRAPLAPPAVKHTLPSQHGADPQRLVGQGGFQGGEFGHRGPAVHREDRRRGRCPRPGPEDQADLEQRRVGEPPPHVPGQHPEQAGQQGRAQQRFVLAERVRHHYRGAAHVLGRQPEQVRVGPRRERPGQHLHVPGLGQRPAHRTAQPLARREPAPGQRARHPDRDVLVAFQPDDLLGQVSRVGEVGPPARRGHLEHGHQAVGRDGRLRRRSSARQGATVGVAPRVWSTEQPTSRSRRTTVSRPYTTPATRSG